MPIIIASMQWDDVRFFLALHRARTVGAAARALGVDPSTVSRRLVALEEALGATLYARGREGVSPTEAAERLLPVAEEIEATMIRFTTTAEGLEREVSGQVRITCPADVAEVIIVPLLPRLLAEHPALSVDLEPGEAILDLTRREADLALRTVRPVRGDLVVTRLRDVLWVVAAAPEMARELGTLRRWMDAPWIGWGEGLASIPPARWFTRHVARAPALRSDSLRVHVAAITAGVGIGLIPEPSLEHFGLAAVKLGQGLREAAAELPTDSLYLVTHRALRSVPRVRVVWELLRTALA
jgi:DNA-binding transcriptional LysR family regulator